MYKLDIDTQKLKLDFKDIINASETATKNTLNTVAFLSRKNSISNINQNFTIRNTFTQRQIQVERVKENIPIELMWSSVGATEKADYMALQEEGGVKEGKNGNILMAQVEARGGTEETKALAQKSKEALIKLFEGRKITLYNLGRDKYFRILADVKADDIEVKEYMIKNGFAKEYDGGEKDSW